MTDHVWRRPTEADLRRNRGHPPYPPELLVIEAWARPNKTWSGWSKPRILSGVDLDCLTETDRVTMVADLPTLPPLLKPQEGD